MTIFDAPHFHNEESAIAFLEAIVWADGIVCPKCGNIGETYKIAGKRHGLRTCKDCRKQFTVKVNTVFESSHIPVRVWLQAAYLLAASKKGFNAHQLHRMLGVTYKTAWFMMHRLREAMRVLKIEPMGGEGSIVEADERNVPLKVCIDSGNKLTLLSRVCWRSYKNLGGSGIWRWPFSNSWPLIRALP